MPALANRRILAGALAVSVALGLAACAPERTPVSDPVQTPIATEAAPLPAPVDKQKSFFDKTMFSIDDPLSQWVVNDKLRPLNPIDYIPSDMVRAQVRYITEPIMRPPAAAAIVELFAAAEAEGGGDDRH